MITSLFIFELKTDLSISPVFQFKKTKKGVFFMAMYLESVCVMLDPHRKSFPIRKDLNHLQSVSL